MVNNTNDLNFEIRDFLAGFEIDPQIIDTCINRQVPADNLYWQQHTGYLDFKIRFLSIPFWLEICRKQQVVPLETLLSDASLSIMENILHFSEEEEQKIISYNSCLALCSCIPAIEQRLSNDPLLEQQLDHFIQHYPEYKSLRRGNFLMFFPVFLCTDREQVMQLAGALADLLTCGCILDDLYDAREDMIANETNILLELGNSADALNATKNIFDVSKDRLAMYIPALADYLDKLFMKSTFKYLTQNA